MLVSGNVFSPFPIERSAPKKPVSKGFKFRIPMKWRCFLPMVDPCQTPQQMTQANPPFLRDFMLLVP